MPLRICRVDELNRRTRGRGATAETLPELVELKTKLANGLKPYEAVEVELPPSKIKSLRMSFRRRVNEYLKHLKLTDYEVQTYASRGKEYVSVAYTPVLGSGKRRAA